MLLFEYRVAFCVLGRLSYQQWMCDTRLIAAEGELILCVEVGTNQIMGSQIIMCKIPTVHFRGVQIPLLVSCLGHLAQNIDA